MPVDPRILIVGLGNLLLGDDGVGVHVVRELKGRLPRPVAVVEVGTAVMDALHLVERADKVLAIDAMQADGPPGTVYAARVCDVDGRPMQASLHQLNFVAALRLIRRRPEILILGVEPETIALGMALSPRVAAAVPVVVRHIERTILDWRAAAGLVHNSSHGPTRRRPLSRPPASGLSFWTSAGESTSATSRRTSASPGSSNRRWKPATGSPLSPSAGAAASTGAGSASWPAPTAKRNPSPRSVSFGCGKYFLSVEPEEQLFKCGLQVERGYVKAPRGYREWQLQPDWDWNRLVKGLRPGSQMDDELRRLVGEGFRVWASGREFDKERPAGATRLKRILETAPAGEWAGFQVYYPMTETEVRSSNGPDLVDSMLAVFDEVTAILNLTSDIVLVPQPA